MPITKLMEIIFKAPETSPWVQRIKTSPDKETRIVINIPPDDQFNWHILAVRKTESTTIRSCKENGIA